MSVIGKSKLDEIRHIFDDLVLNRLKEFDILNEDIVPEGLKPLARSVSWLVEQVVVQNLNPFLQITVVIHKLAFSNF